MATKVFMEALSPTMEEGRLVKWNKNEGDAIKQGDILAEVETDKAVMELVARGEGVLRARLVAEGAAVPVGTLVGVIGTKEEDISALLSGAASAAAGAVPPSTTAAAAPQPSNAGTAQSAPIGAAPAPVATAGSQTHGSASSAASSPSAARTIASPLARRLADDRGLSLSGVHGSGPGGRIVKRDIEAIAAAASAPRAAGAPVRPASGTDFEDVPLTQIRKTIARRLAESIGPIPTFYLTAEFDLSRAAEMRAAAAELGDAYKVSFNDIILKATATALAQHPDVNAHWLGDSIRYHNRVHLGMAVATDDGLIVPVIFDADQKGLGAISRESKELAKKARERKLKPEEYTGSTFSVSNLGMLQIDQFTAIINPPEVGILAIGAIEDKAIVAPDGGFEVRKRLRVTMSCDHRAVDGAVGAKFLQTLRRLIENPLLLVH